MLLLVVRNIFKGTIGMLFTTGRIDYEKIGCDKRFANIIFMNGFGIEMTYITILFFIRSTLKINNIVAMIFVAFCDRTLLIGCLNIMVMMRNKTM